MKRLEDAFFNHDNKELSIIVDYLRFKVGYTHRELVEWVTLTTSIDREQLEERLTELDEEYLESFYNK